MNRDEKTKHGDAAQRRSRGEGGGTSVAAVLLSDLCGRAQLPHGKPEDRGTRDGDHRGETDVEGEHAGATVIQEGLVSPEAS